MAYEIITIIVILTVAIIGLQIVLTVMQSVSLNISTETASSIAVVNLIWGFVPILILVGVVFMLVQFAIRRPTQNSSKRNLELVNDLNENKSIEKQLEVNDNPLVRKN